MKTWLDVILEDGYTFIVKPGDKARSRIEIYDKDGFLVFMRETHYFMTTLIDFGRSLRPEGTVSK